MSKLWMLLLLSMNSCALSQPGHGDIKYSPFKNETVYLSTDLAHVAVFSKHRTRFGPTDLVIANIEWPSSSATYFETDAGVQCLTVGKSEISIEYAVKRPLTAGENYTCLRTTFRVVQCFYECKAAIIEMDRPLSGGQPGAYQSYMYVDNCRGVLILGVVADLREGIPLNAEWLRGEVGILVHPDYPKCHPF